MSEQHSSKVSWIALVPIGIFAALIGALFAPSLSRQSPNELPSMFLGQAAPEVIDTELKGKAVFTNDTFKNGSVTLVNFWASWCVPCRAEHPRLKELSDMGYPVYGVNYKNDTEDALAFLEELGDPYAGIVQDAEGRMGINWGLSGVPETFVIDGSGKIAYRHVGPLTPENIATDLLPAIEAAKK